MALRVADLPFPRTVRIGVSGLARAGKTAFATSLAANLLALGAGRPTLPALARALGGRRLRVRPAPAGAATLPRFDIAAHLAALDADPPAWPRRTDSVALLALDLEIDRPAPFPTRRLRLELLDYPGEWLLDLPLLGEDFAAWSRTVLDRLDRVAGAEGKPFLSFVHALPARAPADESLAEAGHRLYVALLHRLRDGGRSLLQPGRFLMPPPGAAPPWMAFFPARVGGGLGELLGRRYDLYRESVRRDLSGQGFGRVDRLVVLVDLLQALASGPDAFAEAAEALGLAASALRWRRGLPEALAALAAFRLPPPPIRRVAFAATKSDHVAARQRGNLASLLRALLARPGGIDTHAAPVESFAIAAVRCTEDFVWSLEGHPVSAVRGRVLGEERLTRSYPGEVPDALPEPGFWAHRFLRVPAFEPARLVAGGAGGVPQLGLDTLLAWLLADVL